MSYYQATRFDASFEDALARARQALEREGFGILTEIDVRDTLKRKIDAEFRPYRILGACNPRLAHEALLREDKIGTMLPCNLIVQEIAPGRCEVAAVDPVASMQAVGNPGLLEFAATVRGKLIRVIDSLATPGA